MSTAVTLVCGALVQLWSYMDDHGREDDSLDLSPEEIDELVGLPGFSGLMPEDWLEVLDDGRTKLPDFQAHNGVEARRKALTAQRVAKHRSAQAEADVTQQRYASVTAALPDQTRPDQTRSKKVPSEPVERGRSTDVIERLFEHWRLEHDHRHARLDDRRRKAIRRALATYSEADLRLAISGYRNSPHHMGMNDRGTRYDSIELMLRDAAHIDAGIRFHREPPKKPESAIERVLNGGECDQQRQPAIDGDMEATGFDVRGLLASGIR